MSNDPFALPSALRSLEQFLESLAAELRARRAPLEDVLGNLLFVWDTGFGPHELAARLAAVGAAVRAAGLRDVVRQMHTGRAARPDLPGGKLAGFALLDAAVDGDGKHVAGLLAMLHDKFPHLRPDAREALARAAEQLLVVWCDRQAADYPTQFRAEVQRLGLPHDGKLHFVEHWAMGDFKCKPKLSDAAAHILDALLAVGRFAVGRLDAVPDLEVRDGYTGTPNDTITPEVRVSTADTKPKCRKRKIPKSEATVLISDYLLKHTTDPAVVTVPKLVAATGVSAGAVSQNSMWQAFDKKRKQFRKGKLRTVPLSDAMLISLPDTSADDPAGIAARNERIARSGAEQELAALIREQELDDDCRPARRERSRRS